MCTLVKSKVVLQSEKESRNWNAYQKHTLDDAVKRAEREALKYLNSPAGDLWLTMASYSKAEEIMNERLANEIAEKKMKKLERKKLQIIQSFEKRIGKAVEQRNRKLHQLNKIIEKNQEDLATARPGYMTQRLQRKIQSAVDEMNNLPEHKLINELHDSCELECKNAEDFYLDAYEESPVTEDIQTKAISIKANRIRNNEDVMKQMRTEITKFIENTYDFAKAGAEMTKAIERSMRIAMDVAMIRAQKLWMISHGEFADLQREMKHEMFTQYVSNSVATARRKAEEGFKNIEIVREALKGRDIRRLFEEWKSWVLAKKRRARR